MTVLPAVLFRFKLVYKAVELCQTEYPAEDIRSVHITKTTAVKKMRKYNLPSIVACIFAVLLFNGQVSQQFSVDVISQPESGAAHADMHSAIGQKAVTPTACEGSIGSNKCIKIKGRCTCYVTQQLPWRKAFDFCRSNRKNLISLKTAKDQADIQTSLMPIIIEDPTALKTGGVWIAGTKIPAMGTYFWATEQKIFSFANWFYGEPNSDETSQCVYITPTLDANWVSASCTEAYLPFICQD